MFAHLAVCPQAWRSSAEELVRARNQARRDALSDAAKKHELQLERYKAQCQQQDDARRQLPGLVEGLDKQLTELLRNCLVVAAAGRSAGLEGIATDAAALAKDLQGTHAAFTVRKQMAQGGWPASLACAQVLREELVYRPSHLDFAICFPEPRAVRQVKKDSDRCAGLFIKVQGGGILRYGRMYSTWYFPAAEGYAAVVSGVLVVTDSSTFTLKAEPYLQMPDRIMPSWLAHLTFNRPHTKAPQHYLFVPWGTAAEVGYEQLSAAVGEHRASGVLPLKFSSAGETFGIKLQLDVRQGYHALPPEVSYYTTSHAAVMGCCFNR